MDVSFLTHEQFAKAVTHLDVRVRDTPFGQETSLWWKDQLCALGFGNTHTVLTDLKSHYPEHMVFNKCSTPSVKPQKFLLVGTPFQHAVWRELIHTNPGQTLTYQEMATRIGRPQAIRAVGTAVGRNQISLHVPCHRVIRSDGTLGGYRWGVDVKKKILESESNI